MQKHVVKPCPMCRKLASWEDNPWRPFCSERCRMIDLGYWDMEGYRIAGKEIDKVDEVVDEKNGEK